MKRAEPLDAIDDDLELLAFLHYAIAALAGFFGLLPAIYLGMALVAGVDPFARSLTVASLGPPPPERLLLAGLLALAGTAAAVGIAVAGVRLRRARSYAFCRAMAVVSCLIVPFGTMLGLYALGFLARPAVRARFARSG